VSLGNIHETTQPDGRPHVGPTDLLDDGLFINQSSQDDRRPSMNGITANAQALIDAYMSLIWWVNGVVGSLFLLDWLGRRFGHRLEDWLARQQQSVSDGSNSDRSR
jgi:hypothetical protein